MKKIIFIVAVLVILILVYLLGSFLPLNNLFAPPTKSIKGDARLSVKLVLDNGAPLPNVEVDVAKQVGPPSKDGTFVTDETGTAKFFVVPGNYFIYFNLNNFPKNLQLPPAQQIAVEENVNNSKTITIKAK